MNPTHPGPAGDSADAWQAAWRFAAELHNKQQVPGSDLPYLEHLGMVSLEVLGAHAIEPLDDLGLAVMCAILHDAIEDQGLSHAELAARLGKPVADGVLALSKQATLDKSEAMADSLQRIRAQPREVWCVKLADRISNLRKAPAHWTPQKRRAYRAEAQLILDALGSAHRRLAERLAEKIAAYELL